MSNVTLIKALETKSASLWDKIMDDSCSAKDLERFINLDAVIQDKIDILKLADDGVKNDPILDVIPPKKEKNLRCFGVKMSTGLPCGSYSVSGSDFCITHQDQSPDNVTKIPTKKAHKNSTAKGDVLLTDILKNANTARGKKVALFDVVKIAETGSTYLHEILQGEVSVSFVGGKGLGQRQFPMVLRNMDYDLKYDLDTGAYQVKYNNRLVGTLRSQWSGKPYVKKQGGEYYFDFIPR